MARSKDLKGPVAYRDSPNRNKQLETPADVCVDLTTGRVCVVGGFDGTPKSETEDPHVHIDAGNKTAPAPEGRLGGKSAFGKAAKRVSRSVEDAQD
jgi:hypothetical protein